MTHRLTIPGRLPALNEYIEANRTNVHVGAGIKRRTEENLRWTILAAHLPVINNPVRIRILWIEASAKRDPDNIAFAKKFILDALVATRRLKNDGHKQVCGFEDTFKVDSRNPRIEVTIEEEP